MTVIVVANRKGGAGKTTVASHLLRWFDRAGVPFVAIDADPQEALARWTREALPHLERPPIVATNPDMLMDTIADVGDVATVVVDTPAALSKVTRQAVGLADVVLVVTGQGVADLRSCVDTIELVERFRRVKPVGKPDGWVVLNMLERHTRLGREALELVQGLPLPFAGAISRRQAVMDTIGQGVAVFDAAGARDSATEFDAIFRRIHGQEAQEERREPTLERRGEDRERAGHAGDGAADTPGAGT